MVTDKRTIQSDLDYFPVIPYPPNESVLKDYLDFLIDLKNDLEIDNRFCYSDQDITNNSDGGRQIQRNHQHNGWFPYPSSKS